MDNKKVKIIVGAILILLLGILVYRLFFKKEINSISLNTQYIKIYENQKEQLEAKTNIVGNSELIWKSTNPGVVMVNGNGLIEGINIGQAKIIVSTKDGKSSNSCIVEVIEKKIDSIEIDKKEVNLQIGEQVELKPVIVPNELQNEKATWTSVNPNVAKVDENGKVYGLSNGLTIIKVAVLESEAESLIVIGTRANSISINKKELELQLGKSDELKVEINPTDAIDEKIIWESSNPSIVSVDENGNIEAKNIGIVKITATTEYTKMEDICYVTVVNKKYEVKYMELNKTIEVNDGDMLGTLPTMTKDGYNFLGWYEKAQGGNKVSSNTVVTSNMTLYPHWEISYCLPKDNQFSSFTTVAYSDTETFKYRIIDYGVHDIVLIWVDDATKQLKQGLANPNAKGVAAAETILSQVPSNKSLVAINASLFDEGSMSPLNGIVIHDGKVVKNKSGKGGCVGITRDGLLKECTNQSLNGMLQMGILNNFTISHSIQANKSDGAKATAHRTQICQVDKHNFAIISSQSVKTSEAARVLYNFSLKKCQTIFNLDGGGSRKLYYRTHGGKLIKRFGGSRAIPDMLYFTEE